MIFNCYYCGWSINARRVCTNPSDIGKTKLYKNHRFHESCMEDYKEEGHNKNRTYFEHGESNDWDENGYNGYWKVERKIGRIRPKRRS
jgi:hypothetical protein